MPNLAGYRHRAGIDCWSARCVETRLRAPESNGCPSMAPCSKLSIVQNFQYSLDYRAVPGRHCPRPRLKVSCSSALSRSTAQSAARRYCRHLPRIFTRAIVMITMIRAHILPKDTPVRAERRVQRTLSTGRYRCMRRIGEVTTNRLPTGHHAFTDASGIRRLELTGLTTPLFHNPRSHQACASFAPGGPRRRTLKTHFARMRKTDPCGKAICYSPPAVNRNMMMDNK